MKKKRKLVRRLLLALFVFGAVLLMCMPVSAATYKKQWVRSGGRYYYYNNKGQKVTGLKKIGKRYYYFDSTGKQHNGWIKINNDYYYFRYYRGKKGYMVKSRTADGITLNSDGKAQVTSSNKEKLRLLAKANTIVFNITNWSMTKQERLQKCFEYARNNVRYRNLSSFTRRSDWDQYYASYFFDRGYGDCYVGACGFAYLATAMAMNNVSAESSGGHGWASIQGKFYDPNWSWATGDKSGKYFAVPPSLSGVGGRPNYARYRAYIKRIDK